MRRLISRICHTVFDLLGADEKYHIAFEEACEDLFGRKVK